MANVKFPPPRTRVANAVSALSTLEYFLPFFGVWFLTYVLHGWLPSPPDIASFEPSTTTITLVSSGLDLLGSIPLAVIQSALISFSAEYTDTALLLPFNYIPFVFAIANAAAAAGRIVLVATWPHYQHLLDAVLLIQEIDMQAQKGLAILLLSASVWGLYGWAFSIGRDNRQIVKEKKIH